MNTDELKEALAKALQEEAYVQLEDLAKQAISAHPQEAFGYAYLGEALLGELPTPFPEVELCLAKASELEPKNTTYLARFAIVKGIQGANDAAQLMWGKILSIDPNHTEALVAKGAYQLNTNRDYEQALPFFDKALELDNQQVTAYLYRAHLYNNIERYTEALHDIRQAIAISPGFDKDVTLLTIEVFKNLKQLDSTLPLYEELLEKSNTSYLYHLDYSSVLTTLGQLEKAVEQLEKANELTEQKDSVILYTLGETALQAKLYNKAVQAFEACLIVSPELTEAAFSIIVVQMKQAQYEEALKAIKTLQKQVKEEALLIDRATVLEGEILIGLEKLKKAEDLLVPIAKKKGMYQTEAYFQLGRLYHQQGEAAKAYKFVKAAAAGLHKEAKQYLSNQLGAVVDQLRAAAIDANKAAFSKNEQSNFLNKIFGKLWVFDNLKSERLSGFEPQHIENVKQSLALASLMIAEKGILMLSDRQEEMATYKIQKETASGALIEFLPMDGFAGFVAKLQLTADGTLAFSKEKGEAILYKEQSPTDATTALKAVYQAKIQTKDAQYLGKKATPILEQIL
ncbi:MAG: hypothetical protein ACRBFS_15715 [Aureispira sp.]